MRRLAIAALVTASLACPWLVAAAPRVAARAVPAQAEFPGKPTGPIVVEHRRAAEPAAGVPLEITITARIDGSAAGLRIEASATVPRAALVTQPTLLTADENVFSWQITVVPLVADAGYLSVVVSGTIDGVEQARSVAISLRSGAAESLPAAAPDGGEALIALPVEETP